MTTSALFPQSTFPDDRSFHNTDAAYILPNDTSEHQRLEYQAQRFRDLCDDKIFHTPASHMTQVTQAVDIGCGTGVLTTELAKKLPNAEVTGIDLTPVPAVREKLPNISYITGDFMALSDPSKFVNLYHVAPKFDFIFSRLLVLGISDWSAYVKRCVDLVKPGGYIEMHDFDMLTHRVPKNMPASEFRTLLRPETVSQSAFQAGNVTDTFADPPLWFPTLQQLASAKGINIRCGKDLPQLFHEADLEDIQVTRYMCPLGIWGVNGDGLTEAEKRFAPMYRPFWSNIVPMLLRKLAGGTEGVDGSEIGRAIDSAVQRSENWDGDREFLYFYVVCGRKRKEQS